MTIDWSRRGPAAEKTVEILKARVRSLYNEGAQTAIHRQLDRAREREEKQRRRREVMQAQATELERYSKELEATVAERTADLRAILDNVTFGFVIVAVDGGIQPGFTASCATLLAREIEPGLRIGEVLGVEGTPSGDMLTIGIEQIFDDFMPEEVTASQLPQNFTVGERRIKTDYRAVRADDGTVKSVLVTICDVTSEFEARRQAQRNGALVSILRQKQAFAVFVADALSRLATSRPRLDDQVLARRTVHTIKGNSASYGLLEVAELADHIEGNETIGGADLDALEQALVDFVREHEDVLGSEVLAGSSSIEVPESELRSLREILDPLDAEALEAWSGRILRRPIGELIGPMGVFVDRICERLERSVQFSVEGADVTVDPNVMRPVVATLTHLIRNAVDHGLEPENERGAKPPTGRLTARFADIGDAWTIEVEDDGRGIDVDRIVSKAVQTGRLSPAEADALDAGERARLIFLDGLSSRDSANDVSGRGVGMAAVREAVENLGGSIDLDSQAGCGTTIRLAVPKAA